MKKKKTFPKGVTFVFSTSYINLKFYNELLNEVGFFVLNRIFYACNLKSSDGFLIQIKKCDFDEKLLFFVHQLHP